MTLSQPASLGASLEALSEGPSRMLVGDALEGASGGLLGKSSINGKTDSAMSKDDSKGYKQGHQDGASGDNSLAMHSFKGLFTKVGSWLPAADNRGDRFRAGYLAGFEDKIRVIQTDNTLRSSMSETHWA